jgi:hypothetical protein
VFDLAVSCRQKSFFESLRRSDVAGAGRCGQE